MQLKILYWNTAKNAMAYEMAVNHRDEYDVLAIQEPPLNPQRKEPADPPRGCR
jgi:hypothetical protein